MTEHAREPADAAPSERLSPLLTPLAVAWIAPAVLLTVLAALQSVRSGVLGEIDYYMWGQDIAVLAGVGFVLATWRLAPKLTWRLPEALLARPAWWLVILAAASCAFAAWLGHRLVFEGYALSRDEDLALFHARSLAQGVLVPAVPSAWRDYAQALQPMFMIVAGPDVWLPSYLPINAALQSLGVSMGDSSLSSAGLAAAALAATYAVGRRLWPDQPKLALMATVLLATSAQFVMTAMTPYAMTAHLALNMVWLWLFLRGGALGHSGALVTGFLACGLHQLVFHPLFAGPFVLQLWMERRHRLALVYTAGYAAICLFWVFYWKLALDHTPLATTAAQAHGAASFARQVLDLVSLFDLNAVGVMAKNLVRFVTWQHPLAAPLVLLAAIPAFRAGGVLRSLILGLGLTIVAMFVLLPNQGAGLGYRYLHGFLGSAVLLAAWSFLRLTNRSAEDAKLPALFIVATAAALCLLLPLRAWQTHDFVHPYAAASRAIAAAGTDVVIVDEINIWQGVRLVRNDPKLERRPVILRLLDLDDAEIEQLCRSRRIAVFQSSDGARLGLHTLPEPAETRAAREAAALQRLERAGCEVQERSAGST